MVQYGVVPATQGILSPRSRDVYTVMETVCVDVLQNRDRVEHLKRIASQGTGDCFTFATASLS